MGHECNRPRNAAAIIAANEASAIVRKRLERLEVHLEDRHAVAEADRLVVHSANDPYGLIETLEFFAETPQRIWALLRIDQKMLCTRLSPFRSHGRGDEQYC